MTFHDDLLLGSTLSPLRRDLLKYAYSKVDDGDEIPDEAEPLKNKYLHVVEKGLGPKNMSTLSQKKVS
jgi:hypothetical protein